MKKIFALLVAALMLSTTVAAEGNARLNYYAKSNGLGSIFGIDKIDWTRMYEAKFAQGYPHLSSSQSFSGISVLIKTTGPCSIYYKITKSANPNNDEFKKLCDISKGGEIYDVSIPANLHESYDIHFKIQKKNADFGETAYIKNITPISYAMGNGTKSSPYVIFTEKQLAEISHYPDKSYILGDNIKLTQKWDAIESFSGSLDGDGHTISGLLCETDHNDAGLFKELKGGTVKNLYVEGSVKSDKNAGLIAARNEDGEILGCVVSGDVTAKVNNAGGICGQNSGIIEDCLSAAYSVRAGSFAGGICGQNFGIIKNSMASVDTTASEMYAGGIAGTNDALIEKCVAANMNVYDTLTYNSGKLTTNKHQGITKNNYCLDIMNTNASNEEEGEYSQCGYGVDFDTLKSLQFYEQIGWNKANWKIGKDYLLAVPKKIRNELMLNPGSTAYLPIKITNAQQLRDVDNDGAAHYILKNDITLSAPWRTMCMLDGFSGSLDGDGHTIYNLNLKTEQGMFSNIAGGTIKNISFKNVKATPNLSGGILAVCNYGYIENCKIYGDVSTNKAGLFGGVVCENYGQILNCDVYMNIKNNSENTSIGGICGDNCGIIMGCFYRGDIISDCENATIGGICAMSQENSYLLENGASINASLVSQSSYAGGICAIAEGAQIYKNAASGTIKLVAQETAYAGGICATLNDAIIYNAMADMQLRTEAKTGFSGGIAGYITNSNLQNSYSVGSLISMGNIKTGGICGYSEMAFLMQNVALNPEVKSKGELGGIVGEYEMSEVSDNFTVNNMILNGKKVTTSVKNGEVEDIKLLKDLGFYYKSVSDGGRLGWSASKDADGVWSLQKRAGYDFPTLINVTGVENFFMPTYK